MARWLKILFPIHALVGLAAGAPMLLVPGHFLPLFHWCVCDPPQSRLVGAALLALAWGSLRGWRAKEWSQVAILVEANIVFAVGGCAGLLRHLLTGASYQPLMHGTCALLALFAIAWIVAWVQHTFAQR